MSPSNFPMGGTIAVADDDDRSRDSYSMTIKNRGYSAAPIVGKFPTVKSLVDAVKRSGASGVICDFRLSEGVYAKGFNGAGAAAAFFDAKIPVVLITDYREDEINGPIRLYRRKIPVLIPAKDATSERIVKGLNDCARELDGDVPIWRRPRRAMIVVKSIDASTGLGSLVEVVVPQWSPSMTVWFPMELIPKNLRDKIRAESLLIASVNIDAEKQEDLFFDEFEVAPDPEDV